MRLIDADALLDCIPYCDANCASKISKVGAIADMVMLISEAPTIEAEPVVHGRWKRYTDEKFMGYDSRGRIKYRKYYSYECTCCGENRLSRPNYCPNCGAKMDGDGNG